MEGSEDRDDRAVVGVVDVLLDGVGLQRLDERLNLGAVLVAGANRDDVGIGLGGVAGGILGGQRMITASVPSSLFWSCAGTVSACTAVTL